MKVFAPVLQLGPSGAPCGPQITHPRLFSSSRLIIHGISDALNPAAFASLRVSAFQESLPAPPVDPKRKEEANRALATALAVLRAHGSGRFVQAMEQAGEEWPLNRRAHLNQISITSRGLPLSFFRLLPMPTCHCWLSSDVWIVSGTLHDNQCGTSLSA